MNVRYGNSIVNMRVSFIVLNVRYGNSIANMRVSFIVLRSELYAHRKIDGLDEVHTDWILEVSLRESRN